MSPRLCEPEALLDTSSPDFSPVRLFDIANPIPRILYADDDACIRKLGARALVRCGYWVDTVSDGVEAWNALHASSYNLLITDIEMPRLTGLKLAAQVRTAGMLLPIVIASGAAPALNDPSIEWLSIAASLAKPFTVQDLVATAEKALCDTLGASQKTPWMNSCPSRPAQTWGINE